MRTLKTLLFLLLLCSIGYQANAYYQYRRAADAVPPHVRTVKARGGELRLTLAGSGILQALQSKVVAVREVQSRIVRIVEDGQMVKAGQEVCQLDTTTVVKDLRDHREAYDTAMAAIPTTEADVLLNLNNAATKAKKAQQEQQMLLATNKATTDQAQAQVQFNGSELDVSKRQYTRQEGLARDRLVPARQVEVADLDVQSKQLNVVTASKQLEVQQQTEKIGDAQGEMLISDAKYSEEAAKNKARQQIANAKFNAEQARRQLELSQLQLQWCTIKAPIAGLAVVQRDFDPSVGSWRPLRAGDQAFPSRRLMEIIDTAQMLVQADVGEIDLAHVRAGQSARVFPRAAPGVALRARVKSVSEVAQAPPNWRSTRVPGKKVFRVVIAVLDSRPKLLRPGMTADFEVLEEAVNHGVRVPIEAVFPERAFRPGTRAGGGDPRSGGAGPRDRREGGGDGVQAIGKSVPEHLNTTTRAAGTRPERPTVGIVYLHKDGRFWPRAVTLGKRNDNEVMVTRGLKPGDMIAEVQPPASLIGPAAHPARRARATGLLSSFPWGLRP